MNPDNIRAQKLRSLFEGFSIFALFIIIFVVVGTSVGTGAPLFWVLLGFLPSIATVVLCIIVYEESKERKIAVWFMPFLIIGFFFFVATETRFLEHNLDVQGLTGINLIITLLYLSLFFLFANAITEKKPREKKIVQEKDPEKLINSLEDKSKALNFVIGRVYGSKKGGDEEMRSKLRIQSSWYNEVSKIFNHQKTTSKEFKIALKKIKRHLSVFEETEKEVFGNKHVKLKNLSRDKAGTEKIIDVLARNDNDPVANYYQQLNDDIKILSKVLG